MKVVYDTLLKPDRPITDYNTKYSGITYEMMKDVTKRLPDVHRELAQYIGSQTVLIGHSLENDLNSLEVRVSAPQVQYLFMRIDCSR